ncbi:hypothetical protein TIFTF001_009828 [Ficus carica]|uniref:Reverse transcriptase zinc-binding domain-containing protein n=1 Tax=Ficus carica TaxID=3494 RepID=A0AA88D3Y4_FICCA|nr:hypothetical protein TIFTF001_009828 [Ficus carica]
MSPVGWDKEKLESILLPIDRELVWSIPLSSRRRHDKWVWHYDGKGGFSVGSAYRVEMDRRCSGSTSGGGLDSSWWGKLCKSQVPHKVKIHVWRAYHDALPAMLSLSKRGIKADKLCPLCRDDLEDTSHAFWYCLEAQERRNKWIFENKMMNANDIVTWAGRFLGDFLIKINVDAAVDSSLEYIGIGVVARDKNGAVMSFLSRRIFGKFSPHLGECLAVREGVCLANFLRLDNWVVESDALNTVSAIQNPVAEAPETNIVEDIRDYLSIARSDMVCYISRDENRVVHFLTKYVISKFVYCFGVDYVPRWLGPFVKADLAI